MIFDLLLHISALHNSALTRQLVILVQSCTLYPRLLDLASPFSLLQYFRSPPLVGWREEECDGCNLAGLIGEKLQISWFRDEPAKELQSSIFQLEPVTASHCARRLDTLDASKIFESLAHLQRLVTQFV